MHFIIRGSEGYIRDKISIHDIDMYHICSGSFQF